MGRFFQIDACVAAAVKDAVDDDDYLVCRMPVSLVCANNGGKSCPQSGGGTGLCSCGCDIISHRNSL